MNGAANPDTPALVDPPFVQRSSRKHTTSTHRYAGRRTRYRGAGNARVTTAGRHRAEPRFSSLGVCASEFAASPSGRGQLCGAPRRFDGSVRPRVVESGVAAVVVTAFEPRRLASLRRPSAGQERRASLDESGRHGPGATKPSKCTEHREEPVRGRLAQIGPRGPIGPRIPITLFDVLYGAEPFLSRGDRI